MTADTPLPSVHVRAQILPAPPPGADRPAVALDWPVRTMEVVEALDEPFAIRVVVIAPSGDDVDLGTLVGASFRLRFGRSGDDRELHGVVMRAELLGHGHGYGGHATLLEVGPSIATAGLAVHTRVFQQLDAIEIIEAVLGETVRARGSALEVIAHGRSFEPRDYCVQWRETDLAFVTRLLADEGVAWLLTCVPGDGEDPPRERIVVLGAEHPWPSAAHAPVADPFADHDTTAGEPRSLRYGDGDGSEPVEETVASLRAALSMSPGGHTCAEWDWLGSTPRLLAADSEAAAPGRASGQESYTHDRRRLVERDGAALDDTESRAADRAAAADTRAAICRGGSDVALLGPGCVFELVGHPRAEQDGLYRVLRVTHWAEHAPSPGGVIGPASYRNEFLCMPAALGYRPRLHPRPTVHGPHTALVVGPEGDEIHTDQHGRIRVRFAWDRHTSPGGSCWLRVAHAWAGQGFGAMVLPRVGMEVVVAFIDGDPDRPLCTGCVYNGAQVTPDPLPERRTQSTFRSSSTPGGAGYNELTVDDAAGRERIYVRAQRDLVEHIRVDHTTTVGADQSVLVGRDQRLKVDGAQTEHVVGDVAVDIEGKRETQVLGSERLQVEGREDRIIHGDRLEYIGLGGALDHLRVAGTRLVEVDAGCA